MSIALLWAYAAPALAFWMHSVYRLATVAGLRDRRFEATDYVLLAGAALLSSAAWVLLLPIYLAGWARTAYRRGVWKQVRLHVPARRAPKSVPAGC